MAVPSAPFDVVWEVEPPGSPGAVDLHRQLTAVTGVASEVLVPDNHTARATVSSIAVARAAQTRGMRATACLNARDRNQLGFQRDLLTCAFDGIDDVLLVYGDEPEVGERTPGLNVRRMLAGCRERAPGMRAAVSSGLRPLPAWKRAADRLFVQVSYDLDALLRWRDRTPFTGAVYPAVMVVPSVAMARRLAARIPELTVPPQWLERIDRDGQAGVELAAELAESIRASGAFEGVHVVAGRRFEAAAHRFAELRVSPAPTPTVRPAPTTAPVRCSMAATPTA